MSRIAYFGIVVTWVMALNGAALAGPITTLTPLTSNGTQAFAVYVFSEAGDTLSLSEVAPNGISNIFCNYAFESCPAAVVGQMRATPQSSWPRWPPGSGTPDRATASSDVGY